MAKQIRSRIWTSSLDMLAEHINFPDKAYEVANTDKDDFNKTVLGAHFEERDGVQELVINAKDYIAFVSQTLHKYDSRSLIYGIVHDKDIKYDKFGQPVYRNGKRVMDVDKPHLHLLIHFSKAVTLPIVAAITGIAPNLLEKGKTRGRYAFSTTMAYLIHALQPTKYQYDPDEVINGDFNGSIDNESGLYTDFYLGHKDEWESRRMTVEKKARNLNFEKVYEDTMLGKYSKEDLVGGPADLYKMYVEHKDKLDQARAAYLDRKAIQYVRAVNQGNIKIQTLFVFGEAGNGKSYLGKAVAAGLMEKSKNTWRVFQSGSEHPFDDYDGEEIIFLDDVRANSMNASDWLHLLDPHNTGTASARYHDAKPMPRLLVITSTMPPHEFFSYTKGLGGDEPLDQFLRRILWTIHVVNFDDVEVGRRKKVEKRMLKLADKVQSRSETTNDYSGRKNTRVSYKPGNEKTYQNVYEDWVTGTFDEVVDSLVKMYGTYFGLINKADTDLGLMNQPNKDGSALPIVSGGDKLSLGFNSMFASGIKGTSKDAKGDN